MLVAVAAVGINFRDVLNVLGMYPGDPGDPGEFHIVKFSLIDITGSSFQYNHVINISPVSNMHMEFGELNYVIVNF